MHIAKSAWTAVGVSANPCACGLSTPATYMQRVYASVDVQHEVHLVQIAVTLEARHCTATATKLRSSHQKQ